MRKVKLPDGQDIPVLGLGTWFMGETTTHFDHEVGAVRYAIERGISLIDTAEMYANGGAEKVVGAAIKDFESVDRESIFIVSKVIPSNASYENVVQACERSLRRLGVARIDLYLLHWRGSVPFDETLKAFRALRSEGKIRYFGVSNFDSADMEEWWKCDGGAEVATNQVLYNLGRRGVEWDIIPFCKNRNVPVMAYSPLEQGRLDQFPVLSEVAERHGVRPLQVALAWVLSQENVITIPKAVDHQHIDQNIAALEVVLDSQDHALLNATFPPPTGPSRLEML